MGLKKVKPPLLCQQESLLNHLNTFLPAKPYPHPQHCPSRLWELSLKWSSNQEFFFFLISGLDLMDNVKGGRHKLLESQYPPLTHRTPGSVLGEAYQASYNSCLPRWLPPDFRDPETPICSLNCPPLPLPEGRGSVTAMGTQDSSPTTDSPPQLEAPSTVPWARIPWIPTA